MFPNKEPSEQDFYQFCVNPALELRQRVRDELCKLDREYAPISMRSRHPDGFQVNHRPVAFVDSTDTPQTQIVRGATNVVSSVDTSEDEAEQPRLDSTVAIDPPLTEKTIRICDGETGHSYQELFGPYLRGAKSVHIVDPYVRLEYQIRNFLAFTGTLDTTAGTVKLHLTTGAEDSYQEREIRKKLEEIARNIGAHGIELTFEFDRAIHDRRIELDNGWRIIPGRGLDIFHKPDSKYELSEVDQTKRRCRETEIIFLRS